MTGRLPHRDAHKAAEGERNFGTSENLGKGIEAGRRTPVLHRTSVARRSVVVVANEFTEAGASPLPVPMQGDHR